MYINFNANDMVESLNLDDLTLLKMAVGNRMIQLAELYVLTEEEKSLADNNKSIRSRTGLNLRLAKDAHDRHLNPRGWFSEKHRQIVKDSQ